MKRVPYALVFTLVMFFQNIQTIQAIDTSEHRPVSMSENKKLNAIMPETRKPFLDPHAIKPNLDEPTAPTNVHTNSEYLQGQKITATNPNQNMANQIKRERPINQSVTGKKI